MRRPAVPALRDGTCYSRRMLCRVLGKRSSDSCPESGRSKETAQVKGGVAVQI